MRMRVMAIGIHPDDVEIGCGGTVAACAALGHDVTLVDLTRGESSTNGTAEERALEAEEAARILGCARRVNAGLPDAGVQGEDPVQTRAVVAIVREHRPDVVLVPNPDDPHPDHASGGTLVQRALFLANVNGYATEAAGGRQQRWKVGRVLVYSGRREVRPDVVMDITAHYDTKIRSVRAHASQVGLAADSLATPLTDPRFFGAIEGRALVAGRWVGATYGEAFQLLVPLALSDLQPLLGPDR